MQRTVVPFLLAVSLAIALHPITLSTQTAPPSGTAKPAPLKIVVLAGSDAVNVVQQKTAVAPVVEVRDRNNNPVAGAVVRFAIRSGRASFGGNLRALSVVTDATGRAAAAGLTPTANGALQITATASFQGQTAVATITQVNVATAAQAAAATTASGATAPGGATAGTAGAGTSGGTATAGAGAAGAGAGSTGAAAGAAGAGAATGGGISATTIAVVGGAVAGGTLVAKETLANEPDNTTAYTGPFSGQLVITFTNRNPALPPQPCTVTMSNSGTLTIKLNNPVGDSVTGTASGRWMSSMVAATCGDAQFGSEDDNFDGLSVTGPPNAIAFTRQESFSGTSPDGPFSSTETFTFSGVLADGVITGTITHRFEEISTNRQGKGVVGLPVTLR